MVAVDVSNHAAIRETFRVNKKRSEVVQYWRKGPAEGNGEDNWIVTADTQDFKFRAYLMRGWTPLPQFGRVGLTGTDDNPTPFDLYGKWGPILCHKNGPAAFPVSQILTFRLFSEAGVRGLCKGLLPGEYNRGDGNGRMPYFPALAEWVKSGHKITEYRCPECTDRPFSSGIFLARHLRNSHDYDRQEIKAFGEQFGLDFTKAMMEDLKIIKEYELVEAPPAEPDPTDIASIAVETVTVQSGRKRA